MKSDPILQELWKIKDGMAAECNHDLRRLFDRLMASQKEYGMHLVNRHRRNIKVAEPQGPDYGSQPHPIKSGGHKT